MMGKQVSVVARSTLLATDITGDGSARFVADAAWVDADSDTRVVGRRRLVSDGQSRAKW
jgi:hypothetical protein